MDHTEHDSRVFFAAERTLLAWLRTGITVIALGFVVARFGLFMSLLAARDQAPAAHLRHWPSNALGVLFVVVGTSTVFLAAIQHKRFVATLPAPNLPPSYSRTFAVGLSATIGLLGLLLAAYLLVSHA